MELDARQDRIEGAIVAAIVLVILLGYAAVTLGLTALAVSALDWATGRPFRWREVVALWAVLVVVQVWLVPSERSV